MANIVDITPDPRSTPVADVEIRFTDSVTGLPAAVTGVDIADFTLTEDGVDVPLTGLSVTPVGDSYFIDLSTVTTAEGAYVLTLVAAGSGIQDGSSQALAQDASDSWLIGPTADIVDIAPDPRNNAVGTVNITFSEPVTGVDIADFRLSRNGANVPLTGLTVGGTGANYTLNLSTLTAPVGTYVLTLLAAGSGIRDVDNNALTANASDSWFTETAAPTADIIDVTPDPRTTAVGNITIQFSEPVTGVDITDFRLTRNGSDVPLTGLTVTGSGATYTVNLSTVTGDLGNYAFTLLATGTGISDAAGNAMTAGATDTWSLDDVLERQNDTLRFATDLGRVSGTLNLTGLALIDTSDFYRFTTQRAGKASDFVQIAFTQTAGNLNLGNLDLELYNVSGQRLRSSLTNNNSERISLNNLKAGTYYIRVFGKAGATNTNYNLTVNVQASPTSRLTPPGAFIPALKPSIEHDLIFANFPTDSTAGTKTSVRK